MNAIQLKHGPFAFACPREWGNPSRYLVTCDVSSRCEMVKRSTDADWLQAVIDHHDTQKTVKLAAERRLRWVTKAVTDLAANGEVSDVRGAHSLH